MKYIITENQYNFLRYSSESERLNYVDTFREELQEMIDKNLNSLLDLNNLSLNKKGLKYYTEIFDLIVDEDIRVGVGSRVYDINVWALVKQNERNWFFINSTSIVDRIRNMIFDKYGFKVGLKLTMTLFDDSSPS
jgi:hypothetical protein